MRGVFLQVANGGGFEALAMDAAGRVLSRSYAQRVAAHEAGHFLLAYLVGLLPKSYTLSSLDALRRCAMLELFFRMMALEDRKCQRRML